ncbi:MAG: HTTM domain-containing protein [Saprospiraceae bacterium]
MNKLFQPVDIAPLVFFRVIFGILGFADMMGVWTYYHLYKGYFNPDNFQFKYMGFEWVPVLPEPFMSLFFLTAMTAAVFIVIGKNYRISTLVFAICFTWQFFLEKALYLNHGYLFTWICWIMIFLPANRQWSYDVVKKPELKSDTIERWSLWILPFLMGVVYFYGGIAKINSDWLNGNPLDIWLRNVKDMPLLGSVWSHKITPYIMAWSGMLLDLTAAFFLLFKNTRKWILGFILFFHLTNTLIFQIGIFPWLSICLSLLYFPPSDFRKWFSIIKNKIKKLEKVESWWERISPSQAISDNNSKLIPPAYPKKAVLISLFLILLVHLTLPLRHHFFKGNVAWTEEGHRYSWRMMLRSKRGYGDFKIKNTDTNEIIKIKESDYLTDRQREKLFTHPDMIWQFAQHLKKTWQEKGEENIEIYADIKVRLNGRNSQVYIDPETDLSKVDWHFFKTTEWVMPFLE